MTIKIRKRKIKGRERLYFDYYYKGQRKTESLDFYLHLAAPGSKLTKEQQKENKNTLKTVEQIKAIREREYLAKKYDIDDLSKLNASFIEYFRSLVSKKTESAGNQGNWNSCLLHLERYTNGFDITFARANQDWIQGFREYLESGARSKAGQKLSQNTKASYFNKLKAAFKQARIDGIIKENPAEVVKGFKEAETDKAFLTADELKILAKADCKDEQLKRAFLFSCLTGLRWSDVTSIRWNHLEFSEDRGHFLVFKQIKTEGRQVHFISEAAVGLLGQRGEMNDLIFGGLTYGAHTNMKLKEWVYKAGISKDITFHCARHTYATLQLNSGTDFYTVSKMLGHKSVKNTQVYLNVIDKNKIDAANKIKLD